MGKDDIKVGDFVQHEVTGLIGTAKDMALEGRTWHVQIRYGADEVYWADVRLVRRSSLGGLVKAQVVNGFREAAVDIVSGVKLKPLYLRVATVAGTFAGGIFLGSSGVLANFGSLLGV